MSTVPAKWVASLGILTLGLALTSGCNRGPGAAGAGMFGPRPPAPVVAAKVALAEVPVYLDEIGHCVAREVVNVEPQVGGKITAIHFEDGADLKKNQPLFTIDPRPFEAALAGAQALYEKDRALAINARANANRQKQLFESERISPADYDQARYTAEAQEATEKNDAAAVETAKLNLEYCQINSPIDGRAGQRQVDVGNVIRSDMTTPLLTIQRLDPIYVDFTITESDLPEVRKQMANGTLKTLARLPRDVVNPASAESDQFVAERQGELTFLDNAVITSTGTVKLRATVANSDRLFWPGQFVKVRLILQTVKGMPLVPAEALQLSQQGTFVYVIKSDDTVEPRPVKVGQRHGEMLAIEQGLKADEEVVVTGQLTLSPGAKVIVNNAKELAIPPARAAAASSGGKSS